MKLVWKGIKKIRKLVVEENKYLYFYEHFDNYNYITVNKYDLDDPKIRYVLCTKYPELLESYIQTANEVSKRNISYTSVVKNEGVDLIIPKIPITYFYQMCKIKGLEVPIILQDFRVLLYMKKC